MKKLFIALFIITSVALFAQPAKKGKEMKITPSYSPGYYLNLKGDTVKGEIQNNMDRESDYSNSFFFKNKGGTKGMEINSKKAKAYGFDGKNYTTLKMDDKDVYIKYLEQGRLNLFEYKYFSGDAVLAVYFIVDSRAGEDDKTGVNQLIQLNEKSFKKQLKPYFKDQPIVLEPVDKWVFKIDEIRKAVSEFNAMYP